MYSKLNNLIDTMLSAFESIVKSVSDWVTTALDAPSSRAVVFGVPIRGNSQFLWDVLRHVMLIIWTSIF